MSSKEALKSADRLRIQYDRRARLAAWTAGLSLLGGLMAESAQARPNTSSHNQATHSLRGNNNQEGLSAESLISSIGSTMQRLTGEVKSQYAKGNPNIKMTPYRESNPGGQPIQLDYYVVSVLKGTSQGQKVYDKFVVASVVHGQDIAPNEYQVAFNTADSGVSPALDPFLLATEFMQMGATDLTFSNYALNVTNGQDRAKFDIYAVSDAAGATLISTDIATHSQTTVPIKVSQAAAEYNFFEESASKILSEASQ